MPNVFEPEWDQLREQPGFSKDRAFIGRQAGSKRLGASVWELLPGDAAYPYHFHYGDEELLFVLSGTVSLRTPEGWRELPPGETVAFLPNESGAHQITNRSDTPARFLMVSTKDPVDVVRYPDSEKVGANYNRGEPDVYMKMFEESAAVDYWHGESAPDPSA